MGFQKHLTDGDCEVIKKAGERVSPHAVINETFNGVCVVWKSRVFRCHACSLTQFVAGTLALRWFGV